MLLLAADGDNRAFESAVIILQPALDRYCVALVGVADAEDAAQDTVVRLWKALATYRGEAPPVPFMLAIARRACADLIRSKQRQRRLLRRMRTNTRLVRSDVSDSAGTFALSAGIETLTNDQREAFVLTQIVECSYEETAALTEVAIGTVRSRVARARQELLHYCEAAERASLA